MPSQSSGGGGDGALEEALGALDGQILAEREVLEQRSNERPGGAAPAGGASGGGMPQADAQAQTGGPPAPANRPAPPMPRGEAPEDIADAQDDDIVARQLREAALAEPDPELREKLWEEYRRYKGSGG